MTALRKTDYRATEAVLPSPDDPRENILSCLARRLPEFQPALFPHDGTAVLCGSGPSLPSFIEEIRSERLKRRPIVAIKGAHDILCENGIEPDVYISCEAKPRLECVQRANKHTLYLLAGRCGPELFDHLSERECKVHVFHTWAPQEGERGELPELAGHNLIGGGTTSGLRAVTLFYVWGFAKFVLYGYDSCLNENGMKRHYGGTMAKEQTVDRIFEGRRFLCNWAMAMQADEFQTAYQTLPGVTFDVKGDGLIAAIVNARRAKGMQA
jgi:uncharacterized Rossmann fold enzyme